jgi:hypothetical protein
MQLTWSKRRPTQPIFSEQTDEPFYLEPLSLQASIHFRDRKSQSRPRKPRKFKFIAERTPCCKQTSIEPCGARKQQGSAYLGEIGAQASLEQNSIAVERQVYQSTADSPLLGNLDGTQGEKKYPIIY